MMKLTFLGAAGTVTGSKYLLTYGTKKFLIDCGLFQGLKQLRLKNWRQFPVPANEISAIILTHAHIDHSGYIPLLVKNGFRGKIYCSKATYELCKILLPDSGYLQEEDAYYANKKKFSKHHPALPLYTYQDAMESLSSFHPVSFEEELTPLGSGKLKFSFHPAGHILGASWVLLEDPATRTRCLFSGDLGRPHDPTMNPPKLPVETDYLVLESTYGDRLHDPTPPEEELKQIISKVHSRGGTLLIPSFAVGRAQTLLQLIFQLQEQGKVPSMPLIVDSPMATQVTHLFLKYHAEHRLTHDECEKLLRNIHFVSTPEESKQIGQTRATKIIISASGMLTGGRILHHIKRFAPYPEHAILLAGYQAAGTRGEILKNGGKTLKIHGEQVEIGAEIFSLDNLSAHADYQEILEWVAPLIQTPRRPQVFITHGEPKASDHLRFLLQEKYGLECIVPSEGETYFLDTSMKNK